LFAYPYYQGEMEIATFAGGCFWRMQTVFSRVPGVISTVVGFSGGYVPYPIYDPRIVSYGRLLEVFFSSHDPTQVNRQGADIGAQYRSAIFYHDANQAQIAQAYMRQLSMARMYPIATQLVPFSGFYPAESHHQFFEARNPQMMMTY
jgi:peptide-methionine (S)-S-oxide reductase